MTSFLSGFYCSPSRLLFADLGVNLDSTLSFAEHTSNRNLDLVSIS